MGCAWCAGWQLIAMCYDKNTFTFGIIIIVELRYANLKENQDKPRLYIPHHRLHDYQQ